MKTTKIPARTYDEAVKLIATRFFKPGLHILQLAHDDFCPAIRSQRDADCRPPCHPDFYLIEPFADVRDN